MPVSGYGNVPTPTKGNSRPISMPVGTVVDLNRRASESSSESEQHAPVRTSKEKRPGVLSNLFGRKKKTNF